MINSFPFTFSANLSDSYFVDRQDRYVLFKNNPQLAGYFSRLTGVVGEVSYELTPENRLVSGTQGFPDPAQHPDSFKKQARFVLFFFFFFLLAFYGL